MAIFQSMARATAKAIGLDVGYRERYQKAYPKDPQCKMCGKQLYWESKGDEGVTIDHIWPQKLAIKFPILARSLSSLANLQPLCRECNSRKRDEISAVNFEQSVAAIVREIESALDSLRIEDTVRYDIERFLDR
jgi:hypothetical protein